MSYELSAAQRQRVEGFLPGRPGCVGVTAKDNRTFVNRVGRGGDPGKKFKQSLNKKTRWTLYQRGGFLSDGHRSAAEHFKRLLAPPT